MMLAIRPSSNSKFTAFRAISPPKRLVMPLASRSTAMSGLGQLADAALGGQDALGAEDHHQDQDEAEDHALILRRLELGGQIGEVVAENHRARVAQLVEPEGEALEDLEIQHGDHGRPETGPGNGAHAAEEDHGGG